jgi:hypothetical protein
VRLPVRSDGSKPGDARVSDPLAKVRLVHSDGCYSWRALRGGE